MAIEPVFIGRCDELEAEDLQDFDATERSITSQTFRKHLGAAAFKEWEGRLGYRDDNGKLYNSGLSLHTDWCVRFGKGKWKGKPCICLHWSAYHHIWVFDWQ